MLTAPRDTKTIDQLQPLLVETFAARDKLYAVADTLHDHDEKRVCGWFADRLGGYAATFQQMISASGSRPAEPRAFHPTHAEIKEVQSQSGNQGVLRIAKQTEERLAERYHETMLHVDDRDTTGLLAHHQRELEVVESVLRILSRSE